MFRFADRRAAMPRLTQAVLTGFISGFIAVLVFHQPMLLLLSAAGFAKAGVYSMQHTAPFGVPQVISLAFWGGVWGILFGLVQQRFREGHVYWLNAFLFGAIFPTLVAWFIVADLKGLPIAAGGDSHRMITGILINGAWGIGTALFFVLLNRQRRGAAFRL